MTLSLLIHYPYRCAVLRQGVRRAVYCHAHADSKVALPQHVYCHAHARRFEGARWSPCRNMCHITVFGGERFLKLKCYRHSPANRAGTLSIDLSNRAGTLKGTIQARRLCRLRG